MANAIEFKRKATDLTTQPGHKVERALVAEADVKQIAACPKEPTLAIRTGCVECGYQAG